MTVSLHKCAKQHNQFQQKIRDPINSSQIQLSFFLKSWVLWYYNFDKKQLKVCVPLANSDLQFGFLKICRIMENLIILVANLEFGDLFNMVTIYFTVMCSFAHYKITL